MKLVEFFKMYGLFCNLFICKCNNNNFFSILDLMYFFNLLQGFE